MSPSIEVRQAVSHRERSAFARFPWQVYRGDPLWVPPLISEQMAILDLARNPLFRSVEASLLTAHRDGRMVGTIVPFYDQRQPGQEENKAGGFGFFEVLNDYDAAQALLEAASAWHRQRGSRSMAGPMNFNENDMPGVLIEGVAVPPVMMEAHTPSYYRDFLERFGMQKSQDFFAWRAFRSQVGDGLENVPAVIRKVAEAARRNAGVTIRKLRMKDWDREVETALFLFNDTLKDLTGFIPFEASDFQHVVGRVKPFIDPDMALFAEADGKAIGFCIAVPDVNQVLIHLNGRLLPFNWLRINRLIKNINAVSFKLMGVLEAYRKRGIEALLYMEAIRAFHEKGYEWLDGSVTSEHNTSINLLASHMGAERYKHYRIYSLDL
jgi:GNAT superfamily N-acetyltransferase